MKRPNLFTALALLLAFLLPEAASALPAPQLSGPAFVNGAYYQPVVQRRGRYYVKRRTKKKSAAIVAGSAGAGAAIGALAGGGKGAALGAAIGGTSGFIYDRNTHKKVRRRD